MKRYRVWEANRKVFLLPENWLEPELRDDKSPFFKETRERIAAERHHRGFRGHRAPQLSGQAGGGRQAGAVRDSTTSSRPAAEPTRSIHVVARTAGAHRKYYYRRHEFGYWTPWEQIKLDIEDNPVMPVVWNDRLLLFWLR